MNLTELQQIMSLASPVIAAVFSLVSFFLKKELSSMNEKFSKIESARKEDMIEIRQQIEIIKSSLNKSEISNIEARSKLESFEKLIDRMLDKKM